MKQCTQCKNMFIDTELQVVGMKPLQKRLCFSCLDDELDLCIEKENPIEEE